MNDEYAKQLKPAVEKAARQAERRWNSILPADDIEQELWMFILEASSVQNYLRDKPEGEQVAALKIKADSICSQEKIDYDHFTGNYHYTPQDVRKLLEKMDQELTVLDEERFDLDLGLASLELEHPQYHETVISYYKLGYGGADDVERKAKQRAVEKLADLMNRKRSQRELDRTEGPGTKPAITAQETWVGIYE